MPDLTIAMPYPRRAACLAGPSAPRKLMAFANLFPRLPNAFSASFRQSSAENDEGSERPDRVREARAAGACPARHSLHGRRDDRVRGLERSLEMAGGELSDRR